MLENTVQFWQPYLWAWQNYLQTHALSLYAISIITLIFFGFLTLEVTRNKSKPMGEPQVPSDLSAISGEDLMATQLDLARAYIEMGNQDAAKQILRDVMKLGNPSQQQAARILWKRL